MLNLKQRVLGRCKKKPYEKGLETAVYRIGKDWSLVENNSLDVTICEVLLSIYPLQSASSKLGPKWKTGQKKTKKVSDLVSLLMKINLKVNEGTQRTS